MNYNHYKYMINHSENDDENESHRHGINSRRSKHIV